VGLNHRSRSSDFNRSCCAYRQLIDLHDRIVQEQSIVNLLKTNEDTYRNLQNRLSLSQTIMGMQKQEVTTYNDIIGLLSSDVTLKTFIMDPGSIKITVDVASITSLSGFVDRLRANKQITNVSIDRIENKTSVALIGANITATLQTTGQKKL
jgi:hypothetical protein